MQHHEFPRRWVLGLLAVLPACADPCLDDGLVQSRDGTCPAVGGSGSDSTGDADDSGDTPTTDATDMCADGMQNGDESDVDCGGSCPNTCGSGSTCDGNEDCASGTCNPDGTCADATCRDGVRNGDETDVDCGGETCDACPGGDMCTDPRDCRSRRCDDGVCAPDGCSNEVQDGDETDVDCGGGTCPPCDDDRDCVDPSDCTSGVCDEGVCIAATCDDGVHNRGESDVDCGGPRCDPCPDDGSCVDDSDCRSGVCDRATMLCLPPSCDDGVHNGDESDVDCGGSCPDACDDGDGCTMDADCASLSCDRDAMVCVPPECDDGIQNGDETDFDCGGSCGPTCDVGEMCLIGNDCISLVCDPATMTCSAPTCDDGVQNGDESDVDCGGSCGATCEPGETCTTGLDCEFLLCLPGGTCADLLTVDAAPVCSEYLGAPVPLTATAMGGSGMYTYAWTPAGSLDDPTSPTPLASPSGFETYTITVDDGFSQAQDTATVVDAQPFDLDANCTLYQGNFELLTLPASISYSAGGTVACELGNNDFGLHLCDGVVFENIALTGHFEITEDAGDDDLVGFVWGAQDASTFYSMSWKRQAQGMFGCTVPQGIVVKRVESFSFLTLDGADMYCPADTGGSTLLLDPNQTQPGGPTGWVEATDYTVTIAYTAMGSDVTITHDEGGLPVIDAQFTVADTTFTSGFFGSTTYSQANACVGPLSAACL